MEEDNGERGNGKGNLGFSINPQYSYGTNSTQHQGDNELLLSRGVSCQYLSGLVYLIEKLG